MLVFGVGVFATPSFASKTSLLPDLVGEDEARLGEANALLQTANRLAALLGPPIAGVLIGVFGATEVLLIDAATFVVGFLLTATLVHAPGIVAEPDAPKEHAFRAVYRFLSQDPLLRPWSVVLILGDVMWLALFAALPVLVLERFGDEPAVVGLTFAGFGLGAVVGGAIAFRLVGSVDRVLLASLGEIGMALPLWLLLVHASPALLVVAFVVAGFANGLVNPRAAHDRAAPHASCAADEALLRGDHRDVDPRAGGARRHGPRARALRRRPDARRARRDRHRRSCCCSRRPGFGSARPTARSPPHERAEPPPRPRRPRARRRGDDLDGRLADDLRRAAVVRADHDGVAGAACPSSSRPRCFRSRSSGSPSGAVTARIGARRTMLICDASRAILFTAIPTLHLMGMLSFAGLVALVFLVGIFMVPHASAQRVIVPELVGEDAGEWGRPSRCFRWGWRSRGSPARRSAAS